jgi:uncharacterized Zn finger protein (UPF0148 family)
VADCFCGCGRQVSLRWSPVNTRGRQIQESIDEVRSSPGRGRNAEDREYVQEAERALRKLETAIHEQRDADRELERETRELLKRHKRRYGRRLFGRWSLVRR